MSKKQLTVIKQKLLAEKERLERSIIRTQSRLSDAKLLSEQSSEEGEAIFGYEERAVHAALIENSKNQLCRVCEALERIKRGTYGICKHTYKQIPIERLMAQPMADSLVEVA